MPGHDPQNRAPYSPACEDVGTPAGTEGCDASHFGLLDCVGPLSSWPRGVALLPSAGPCFDLVDRCLSRRKPRPPVNISIPVGIIPEPKGSLLLFFAFFFFLFSLPAHILASAPTISSSDFLFFSFSHLSSTHVGRRRLLFLVILPSPRKHGCSSQLLFCFLPLDPFRRGGQANSWPSSRSQQRKNHKLGTGKRAGPVSPPPCAQPEADLPLGRVWPVLGPHRLRRYVDAPYCSQSNLRPQSSRAACLPPVSSLPQLRLHATVHTYST